MKGQPINFHVSTYIRKSTVYNVGIFTRSKVNWDLDLVDFSGLFLSNVGNLLQFLLNSTLSDVRIVA